MKLRLPVVLAHAVKDVRALRVMFLLWAVCIVFDLLLVGSDAIHFRGLGAGWAVSFGLLQFAQFPLAFVLLVAILQEDPLTEPDAFWRTRPISRLELLAAKALLAGGMIVVSIAVWKCLPMQPRPSFLGTAGILAAGLAAFASVTASIARLAATAIGTILAVALLSGLLDFVHRFVPSGWAASGTAFPALLIAGLLAATVYQYLTLRMRFTLGLLAALLLLAKLLS